ncbi:MAG: MerR family transcriptional regulator [Phycisphaerae bacterium]|nr:MerR family transcriptional regulator [Phycisphaerae bacterium]
METIAEKLRINPPVKRYKIGEVANFSGLSRQTVHNYTIMGLITESDWSEGGHRLYDEAVFARLAYIDQLKRNKTLRQIRELIAEYDRTGRPLELNDLNN